VDYTTTVLGGLYKYQKQGPYVQEPGGRQSGKMGRTAVGGRVREFTWNLGTVWEGYKMQLPQIRWLTL